MSSIKRRVVGRGKPITELVKGSLNYTLHTVERAFYQSHNTEELWVQEVFEGHIIVNGPDLAFDEFFFVSYTRNGSEFAFAPRDQWEIVELNYRPRDPGVTERRRVLVDFVREGVHYTCEHTRCEEPGCKLCAQHVWGHGPYWFAEVEIPVSHKLGGSSIAREKVLLGEEFIPISRNR